MIVKITWLNERGLIMSKRKLLTYCFILLLICFLTKWAEASDPNYPDIVATDFVRNYDADTITVNICDWPDIIGQKISVRVNGIDTPEMRGGTDYSKALAKEARDFVTSMLKCSQKIVLKNPQRGKYFRIVADVEFDGVDLGKLLVSMGYAKVYDGQSARPDWSTP